MFHKKSFITLLAIGGLLMTASATYAKPEAETIKIGAILTLTGPLAYFGEYAKKTIDYAVEEKNEKGGINGKKIEVMYGDCKSDRKEAVSIMNKFISVDKIPIVFTTLTEIGMALVPIADRNKVAFITTIMLPDFAKSSKFAFSINESITQESTELAKYMLKKGYKNAAVVHINNAFGNEAKNAFEKQYTSMGGKLHVVEAYNPADRDFKGMIAKLKIVPIDSLYLIGYGPSLGIFSKQLAEAGRSFQLFSSIGMVYDYIFKIAGAALDGAIVVMPNFVAKEQADMEFVKKYEARTKSVPNFETTCTYNAFNVIFQAIEKGGYTGTGIQKAMSEIKEYDGVGGKLFIDEDGNSRVESVSFRTINNMELGPPERL